MITALIAALCFRSTLESASVVLTQYDYISQMLSKSHFSRRLHRLKETLIFLLNGFACRADPSDRLALNPISYVQDGRHYSLQAQSEFCGIVFVRIVVYPQYRSFLS